METKYLQSLFIRSHKMSDSFLYKTLDILKEIGKLPELPEVITQGLSRNIELREYQIDAFKYFIEYYTNEKLRKNKQLHVLFHMATGSGKTVIMAGLLLYLYIMGYKRFLFFVNQSNILEKTIDNFTNPLSNKYLFNDAIEYQGRKIQIKRVENFSTSSPDDIEIVFTTTQKLHMELNNAKENSLTYEDFENNKIVFISDESHHVNSLTKRLNANERLAAQSWEYSVTNALRSNKDSIMLEFTATCDLKDSNVNTKYKDKILFNYPLVAFRESGYTKDFQNFATDSDLWTRTLIALVLSEYRKYLFSDLKLNIKPVVMLKSKTIIESEFFYNDFFSRLIDLSASEIEKLKLVNVDVLTSAIDYFEQKDSSLNLLIQSLKTSFSKNTAIIMNGASDNNKEKQLLVNSLEDLSNPVRIIFAVDMLNEGWDVLNLFDIVRLYDSRQSSGKAGKIGSYTIREAQLIGRGARYCPFITDDVTLKYKRKFDSDLTNKNRILETMYFHSKNDSRYISELKRALIETGLQAENPFTLEYILKDEFKTCDFYKTGLVYSNSKVLKDKNNIKGCAPSMRSKTYYYSTLSGIGETSSLIGGESVRSSNNESKSETYKFKDLNLNILLGAIECFEVLKFSILKDKYPSLSSYEEFLTSDSYLGNSSIEIKYAQDYLTGKDIFLAVKSSLNQVAALVSSLKPSYSGTKEFNAHSIKSVLRNKKIYVSCIDQNGGKGASQNNCSNSDYQLNLEDEKWYVYNDNFGTSEEKLFLKYFKNNIVPKLEQKNLEYYVIRNERIPELAIYSFEAGERFEPDFLLFVRKKTTNKTVVYQSYIEPKGNHLLELDAWKEDFLIKISDEHIVEKPLFEQYKIIGLPFFNKDNNLEAFDKMIDSWISEI
jgi:type III restriction-modification enzyme